MAVDEHLKEVDFIWGQTDCAVLFSDVVFAITDCDPFEIAGRWSSALGAAKALARTGHRSVKSFCDASFDTISPSMARRGDAGYVGNPEDPLTSPAIVLGAEAISRGLDGWVRFPVSTLTTAYRIG
ncbi:DUF6950 family protein [Hyphomicrobium sp. ghe19]|uniref:DUF6950 family protein n=1 Tax=Hyphomicrobium sp. ghe19 TaxID=2682968 RepID=UPI0030D44824